MQDEESAIQNDSLQYPTCHYSHSSSKSCSNVKNSYVCETLKSILRHCPNKQPVEIFSKKNIENSDNSSFTNHSNNIFEQFFSESGTNKKEKHVLDSFAQIMKIFDAFDMSGQNQFNNHLDIADIFPIHKPKQNINPPHRIFNNKNLVDRDNSGNAESFIHKGHLKGDIEKL